MTIINLDNDYMDYDPNKIEHLHEVLIEMFKDFIKICDENNIPYFLHGGTTIGAVRHGGFIPWDDEIDVALFRDDYEKLIKILEKEDEKYYITNWKNEFNVDENCYTPKTLFCLKNTRLKTKTLDSGIFIDLNVLDDMPKNRIQKFIFIKTIKLIKFIMGMAGAIKNDLYTSRNREIIGHASKFLFDNINIPNYNAKLFTWLIKKYRGKCEMVCSIGEESFFKAFHKNCFDKKLQLQFEQLYVNVPKGYDEILKVFYGDYMKIPPKNERFNHNWELIDFGEY